MIASRFSIPATAVYSVPISLTRECDAKYASSCPIDDAISVIGPARICPTNHGFCETAFTGLVSTPAGTSTTLTPPITNPRINRTMMVIPTVSARDRCPISQYPAPCTTQVERATIGGGTELEDVEAIVGDYSTLDLRHCNEGI